MRIDISCSIKCDQVKVLYVPQYERLNIERILNKIREYPEVNEYLPDDRDMHKVPRQWLINVAYTVIGEPFAAWVKDEIASRNEELAKKQKLLIEMDSEVAQAFHRSVNISSKCFRRASATLRLVLISFLLCSFPRQ